MQKKESIALLNILREIQKRYNHLPEKEIKKLSKKTNIPLVKIYETASFYSMFSFKRKGRNTIRLCNSPSCYINGSLNILKEIKRILKIDINQTTKDKKYSLELTSCIGCCDKAPAIMLNNELIGNITKAKLRKLLK
jgi:NADH-quinone oxidoreductase subunit E